MNLPRGKARSLILGSCPKCESSNLVKLGKWAKKDSYNGEQRYRCNNCRHILPHSKLGPLNVFVFRLDEDITWSAYIPDNPKIPVMTDINQYGNKWSWNCYDIGLFSSRNELVKHYLRIKNNLKEYVNHDRL